MSRWRNALLFLLVLLLNFSPTNSSLAAEGNPAVAPLLNLLKSGRLPEERIGTVVELICRRGDAADLTYVYSQVVADDGYTGELRLKALECLADAAQTRKVQPAGDLSEISGLIADSDGGQLRKTQLIAIRLVGLWKVKSAVAPLSELAKSEQTPNRLRYASLDALVDLAGPDVRETIVKLTSKQHPQAIRYRAVAALARIDLTAAAKIAVDVLHDAQERDELPILLDAFLQRRGAPEQLADALSNKPPPENIAKIALRYMYSIGRTDVELGAVLSEAAGIEADPQPLTKSEILQLAVEVQTNGNPQLGEAIFRRADLSCMKCHAVSKAGGQIGPDLSAVGSSSPVDYLINSILEPNQAVKEAYITRIFVTEDGLVHQGIVADRDDDRVIVKDATSKQKTIPTAEIIDEAEGISLMPKGLTKFLTHSELIDLVSFLSQLGKPGEFAIRTTPTVQRWRLLQDVPSDLVDAVPDDGTFLERIVESEESLWLPVYGKVAGDLPLDELRAVAESPILYLYGELDVTEPGDVVIRLDSADGIQIWIDEESFGSQQEIKTYLTAGRHKLSLRIDTRERSQPSVRAEVLKPSESTAEYVVVAGQ